MSISELEKKSCVSNGSISKWVNSMPKADSLYSVAKVLEVDIEYFLNNDYTINSDTSKQSDEKDELLKNYNVLDKRGRHKIHTVIYEELDRMKADKSNLNKPEFQKNPEAGDSVSKMALHNNLVRK